MPVTAKLSLRFYEKLGEDVANELVDWFNSVDATYRSDLRDLNELNFARFDAKLEQRLAELENRLAERLGGFRAELTELRAQMGAFRTEVRSALVLESEATRTELRSELVAARGEVAILRQDLTKQIAGLRVELIKWAFVFFTTAALAVIGLR
jgi:hypothetical protein